MTLGDRCAAFNRTYAKWPASQLYVVKEQGKPVIYGRWLIGNNYRNSSSFYGAYPPSYVDRVAAIFPDLVGAGSVLHAFSGSLPKSAAYDRCDIVQDAEYKCNVYELSQFGQFWRFILADPPYTSSDAEKYRTPGVDRRRALSALADVTEPGGFLAWLDTCWPMHSKRQWRTVGRIAVTRSTNHRFRDLTLFERTETRQ